MKTQIQKPKSVSHTIQTKTCAANQADMKTVLQKRACSVESVQRQADNELDDELLQGKFETAQREALDDEELLQGKFSDTAQRAESQSPPEGGGGAPNQTGIPDPMKTNFENLSGFSFDDVRVHYNSPKPAQLQALAYTQGSEVHIVSGQEKHLGHELGHVVQQKQGRVQPTMQLQGVNVNDNDGLEREASLIGEKAIVQRVKNICDTIQFYDMRNIKRRDLVQFLIRNGFTFEKGRSRHPMYVNGNLRISVPTYNDNIVPQGTLNSILSTAGLLQAWQNA